MSTSQNIQSFNVDYDTSRMSWRSDVSFITASSSGFVCLWDVRTEKPTKKFCIKHVNLIAIDATKWSVIDYIISFTFVQGVGVM